MSSLCPYSEDEVRMVETLIDRHGVQALVGVACDVCQLKAEHLRENWQDDPSAKGWQKAANWLSKLWDKSDIWPT